MTGAGAQEAVWILPVKVNREPQVLSPRPGRFTVWPRGLLYQGAGGAEGSGAGPPPPGLLRLPFELLKQTPGYPPGRSDGASGANNSLLCCPCTSSLSPALWDVYSAPGPHALDAGSTQTPVVTTRHVPRLCNVPRGQNHPQLRSTEPRVKWLLGEVVFSQL